MTDLDVIERLQSLLGGKYYSVSRQAAHHKPAWVWRLSGLPAVNVMLLIRPSMGTRRTSQIDSVLSVWYAWQSQTTEKEHQRMLRAKAAVDYYNSMGTKSLRVAAEKFGVSHVTVRNYVQNAKS